MLLELSSYNSLQSLQRRPQYNSILMITQFNISLPRLILFYSSHFWGWSFYYFIPLVKETSKIKDVENKTKTRNESYVNEYLTNSILLIIFNFPSSVQRIKNLGLPWKYNWREIQTFLGESKSWQKLILGNIEANARREKKIILLGFCWCFADIKKSLLFIESEVYSLEIFRIFSSLSFFWGYRRYSVRYTSVAFSKCEWSVQSSRNK